MSRGANQKFKFTYLMRVMLEKTDDDHALTMSQIMDELARYDVTAERKSIYADFADMTERFGIEIIKEQVGRSEFKDFDMANIAKSTFGMYGGSRQKVKIRFENSLCGVFLDRFGKDITFLPVDGDHSEFYVEVNVSPQFFGWLFGLGPKAKLVGPGDVVEELRDYIDEYVKEGCGE